ncbi:MAG: hypothetical protein LBT54_07855, partial [Bifidobacteriaceae bacterium]|nr:hypothetical protein [Bifidobacteriaceae bacterium]
MSQPIKANPDAKARRAAVQPHSRNWGPGFFAKLALMAVIDALGLYGLFTAWTVHSTAIAVVLAALLVAANIVYFSKRMLPAKYLVPGMVFLLVFQVFVMGYTAYVAFTNYGQGHMTDKPEAIAAIEAQLQTPLESSPTFPITVLDKGGELYFGAIVDGRPKTGTSGQPLTDAPDATVESDQVTAVPGFEVLSVPDVVRRQLQKTLTDLRVPLSERPEDGVLATSNAKTATLWIPTVTYQADTDTMVHSQTGAIYRDNGHGVFAADDGTTLPVGWRATV